MLPVNVQSGSGGAVQRPVSVSGPAAVASSAANAVAATARERSVEFMEFLSVAENGEREGDVPIKSQHFVCQRIMI